MGQEIMLKAFSRAAIITLLLIILCVALIKYTIITIIVIVFGWLALMFYTDPPENWD